MSTSTPPPSPELYFDTIFAAQRGAALKSAIDLNLFTAIGDGAGTPTDLARACGAPARGMRILADFMTTLGFVTKTGDRYALTPDSAMFLSKRSPAYLGGTTGFLCSAETTRHLTHLTETIRNGAPRENIVSDENPEWIEFANAMMPMMMPAAQAIADILGVGSAGPQRVLDIAAGHGLFGIVIAQRNPAAQIVAVDWTPVLAVATGNATKMGVGDRHRPLAGSAFTVEYGTGFDVALVTNFLHHFDRETCVTFLKKLGAALKSGGRVAILEFVPNDDRVTPPMAARFAMTMLASTPGGDAYTFRELDGMLKDAGFANATLHPLPGPESVVVATR